MKCWVLSARCCVLVLVLGAVVLGAVPAAAQDEPPQPKKPRQFELRGYVTAGTEKTESPETFDAILGTDRLTLLGGGGELIIRKRWMLRGQVAQFSDTGTRVFVDTDKTVFPLNIPLDVTVRSTDLSAGYRFLVKPRWALYAAGGWSKYQVTEKSNAEIQDSEGTGWHLLGGVDVKPHKWVMIAAETQWTKTEDIFSGGAAEVLNESRLGGLRFAVRIGFAF